MCPNASNKMPEKYGAQNPVVFAIVLAIPFITPAYSGLISFGLLLTLTAWKLKKRVPSWRIHYLDFFQYLFTTDLTIVMYTPSIIKALVMEQYTNCVVIIIKLPPKNPMIIKI